MFRDLLEGVGRAVAAAARNPKWRVTSLERRAFGWRREGARLQRLARRSIKEDRRKRLYKRAEAAFARSVLLDERAQELAERYGLN